MYDDNVALRGPFPYSSPCVLHNRHRFLGVGLGRLAMGGGLVCNLMCVCTDKSGSSPLLKSGVHMGRFNKGPRWGSHFFLMLRSSSALLIWYGSTQLITNLTTNYWHILYKLGTLYHFMETVIYSFITSHLHIWIVSHLLVLVKISCQDLNWN